MAENESIMSLERGDSVEKIKESGKLREFTVNIENINFRLLVDGQHEKNGVEPDVFFLHSHVSVELFACVFGNIALATEEGKLTLSEGDLAIVPPGVPHCMLPVEKDAESAVISFICDKRADKNTPDLYSILSAYVCTDGLLLYRGRMDICSEVAGIVRLGQNECGILPALKTVELLIRLSEMPSEKNFDTAEKGAEGKFDIQRMMRLDTVIASSYMKKLSMKEIADELYISSRQLDRIVRKRYGKTLHKVIMETRLRSAERMLMTTNMTVQEIGSEVGFSSNAGFYREFSRLYGTTPAEYRKKAGR